MNGKLIVEGITWDIVNDVNEIKFTRNSDGSFLMCVKYKTHEKDYIRNLMGFKDITASEATISRVKINSISVTDIDKDE